MHIVKETWIDTDELLCTKLPDMTFEQFVTLCKRVCQVYGVTRENWGGLDNMCDLIDQYLNTPFGRKCLDTVQ